MRRAVGGVHDSWDCAGSEGASLAEARERFDVDVLQRFASELAPLFEQKLIAYDASTQRLRLTERGMEVGNQIFEVFVIT